MPESLKDTLRTAMAETMTQPTPVVQETKQEPTVAASAETKTGETAEKEFVSGIDISDIPVQDRPRIREKLSEKAKLLERGYQPKFQEIAEYKKERERLSQMGLTIDEAATALNKYVEAKKNPVSATAEKKDALKTLDKLIASAPLEQQAALSQLRQIVKEETPVDLNEVVELKRKVSQFEQFMNMNAQESTMRRQTELNNELDSLRDRYGDDFIEKYRTDVVSNGVSYKGNARQLLHAIAPADELEQAITAKVKPGKQITTEKANAITSSTPGLTSSSEQINIKQSYKNLLKDITRLGR